MPQSADKEGRHRRHQTGLARLGEADALVNVRVEPFRHAHVPVVDANAHARGHLDAENVVVRDAVPLTRLLDVSDTSQSTRGLGKRPRDVLHNGMDRLASGR
jgi:hypothetical protein